MGTAAGSGTPVEGWAGATAGAGTGAGAAGIVPLPKAKREVRARIRASRVIGRPEYKPGLWRLEAGMPEKRGKNKPGHVAARR